MNNCRRGSKTRRQLLRNLTVACFLVYSLHSSFSSAFTT